jgi:maltose O-acetyltransferase
MKALHEIGWTKTVRFLFTSLYLAGFRLLIFPPLRSIALVLVGVKIGKDTVIHDVRFFNAYRTGFSGLSLGKRCFVGDECLIDLADKVVLADDVTLAERVTILTHTNVGYANHPLQKYFPPSSAPVHLERGVFVGVNATLLPGVTIGECAFIAAGSVVTDNVPAWTLVGGVPARMIRQLVTNV